MNNPSVSRDADVVSTEHTSSHTIKTQHFYVNEGNIEALNNLAEKTLFSVIKRGFECGVFEVRLRSRI